MKREEESEHEQIKNLLERLHSCRRVLFITGAGVSAASGLPTYRGAGGLYEESHPEENMPIEELLSGPMLKKNPKVTWKYLSQMEHACRNKTYNAAHRAIADLESLIPSVTVLTQNIDGFHLQAGSSHVIQIHGNIHNMICMECNDKFYVDSFEEISIPPVCKKCGGRVRPGVVLFQEMLPSDELRDYEDELSIGFDAIFSIGTSSLFPYIVSPVIDAVRKRIVTVEVNPVRTELSSVVSFYFASKAESFLPKLVKEWKKGG